MISGIPDGCSRRFIVFEVVVKEFDELEVAFAYGRMRCDPKVISRLGKIVRRMPKNGLSGHDPVFFQERHQAPPVKHLAFLLLSACCVQERGIEIKGGMNRLITHAAGPDYSRPGDEHGNAYAAFV